MNTAEKCKLIIGIINNIVTGSSYEYIKDEYTELLLNKFGIRINDYSGQKLDAMAAGIVKENPDLFSLYGITADLGSNRTRAHILYNGNPVQFHANGEYI